MLRLSVAFELTGESNGRASTVDNCKREFPLTVVHSRCTPIAFSSKFKRNTRTFDQTVKFDRLVKSACVDHFTQPEGWLPVVNQLRWFTTGSSLPAGIATSQPFGLAKQQAKPAVKTITQVSNETCVIDKILLLRLRRSKSITAVAGTR